MSQTVPAHVPPHLVHMFDFRRGADLLADPWDVARAMNDLPDVFWSPALGGFWVVTRARLIEEVFRRHDLFSSRQISIPPIARSTRSIPAGLDPPEHGKYRRPMSQRMFSPRALENVAADTRQIAHTLFDAVAAQGGCDFVASIARPLPVETFLRMFGLPAERRDEFISWVSGFFHGRDAEEILAAHKKAEAFMAEWIDARLAEPGSARGHILPTMMEIEIDGAPISRDALRSMSVTLLNAGLDTITSGLTHIMLFLAQNPRHRQALVDDPGLIPGAIEELLRRFGIANIARVVADDIEFAGVAMRQGDMVLTSTMIAGMDRQAHPDPELVDFARKDVPLHHAFGSGPHICPGAHLARVQLAVVLEQVLPRMPGLRLAEGARLAYISGITLGLRRLDLQWETPQ